jgi:hypothetical protein
MTMRRLPRIVLQVLAQAQVLALAQAQAQVLAQVLALVPVQLAPASAIAHRCYRTVRIAACCSRCMWHRPACFFR